jgi:hypothetical protein
MQICVLRMDRRCLHPTQPVGRKAACKRQSFSRATSYAPCNIVERFGLQHQILHPPRPMKPRLPDSTGTIRASKSVTVAGWRGRTRAPRPTPAVNERVSGASKIGRKADRILVSDTVDSPRFMASDQYTLTMSEAVVFVEFTRLARIGRKCRPARSRT